MTTAIIGFIVAARAVETDRLTQYGHHVMPMVALAGILTVLVSLSL